MFEIIVPVKIKDEINGKEIIEQKKMLISKMEDSKKIQNLTSDEVLNVIDITNYLLDETYPEVLDDLKDELGIEELKSIKKEDCFIALDIESEEELAKEVFDYHHKILSEKDRENQRYNIDKSLSNLLDEFFDFNKYYNEFILDNYDVYVIKNGYLLIEKEEIMI